MSNDVKIYAVNEIAGAYLLGNADEAALSAIQADTAGYIENHFGVNFGDVEMSFIENTDDTVHLGLPYYEMVEELQAAYLDDESLDNIAGGEILVTLGFALTGLALVLIPATTGTVCIVGACIGGAVGAVAVAGIAGGAAHAATKGGK